MIIAIDFDGTMVSHEYPRVGKDIGSQRVISRILKSGHKIILWTMRSGKELADAVSWCEKNGIELYGVNENPSQNWTESPKAYAQIYIDDSALGCPVKRDMRMSDRPFVDWDIVEAALERMHVI